MYIAPRASDPITHADKMHREHMERGSEKLWQRIYALQNGKPSRAANDDLLWDDRSYSGLNHRPAADREVSHLLSDRDPCARCAVRQDLHAEFGCKTYIQGRN